MPGFRTHTGRIAVYPGDNVDTDRIIPARFLSRLTRTGYGELLFHDVRGPDYPLGKPDAEGGTVLVVGSNFGCGSSREHAVWAIQQAGYCVVISRSSDDTPGFSDIFRQNSANCGLLLVELPADQHALLVNAGSGTEVTVNLAEQNVQLGSHVLQFEIAAGLKQQLISGLDLVGSTMQHADKIAEFERRSETFSPSADTESGA
ncbi:MAG: 3-isopropylmalate dehydratase small subunit [Armatimonadetes bacterium]|nr:3-isopropylmalate dehydratase small subunit [Armatimonadota bacterium]